METLDVKIQLLYNGSKLPEYQREGDCAMDVFACVERPLKVSKGNWEVVPLGFAVQLPEGYKLTITPRSGLAVRHGVTVLNSPGLIDSNYRGEVKAILINHGREDFTVYPDARIAQCLVEPVPKTNWVEVDELDSTERGAEGFGSTGV
jgi:dUTP pyrophosphatase